MDATGPGGMGRRDPTCVFRVDRELIEALDGRFGPPLDSYLMGWQVWLEPAGDGDLVLEYRLHPPVGFSMPDGLHPEEVWDEVVTRIARGADPLRLGEEERRLEEIWVLLEVYPGFGDPAEPHQVRAWAEEALGQPALAAGHVDHDRLGKRWERRPGSFDLPGALLEELEIGA